MATQTQTVRRPVVQPERVHDYLYDTHHVLASERDHARATLKAHTSTNRVKRVPHFQTMFSELRHHPRFQMKLDVTDPVPKFVSRQWRGYADQARESLIRYSTFNYDPSVSVPEKVHGNQTVSGQNRYKFFRRPIIPFLQQVPPDVILASARQDPLALGMGGAGAADMGRDRPRTPLVRSTMTQTDYRDSEAQTDPYTPEYVVRPGSQPELLTLATLSYGRGLPAGQAEVEMIERARAKRAWEETLPALNDTSQLDRRRKMMDEMERKEWALRESEIEKLQEARLEVLQKLLKAREERHQDLNAKRLDRLWAKKQAEKENRVKHIRNEHIKAIRKLTKKRKAVEGKLERRDVTKDYSDYASQSYAPMTRVGVFLDRGSEQFVVKSRYLNTYQGLLELESTLPDFVVQPRIKAPKPKTVTKSGFVKRKYRQQTELAELHQVIKEEKSRVEEPPKPLRFLQKIEKPIPRPPTPTVTVPSEEEEQKELATIFLQQVIRGRAVQNMMFEGKEKRKDLIRELRSTHALQEAEQSIKKQEKQATLALQRQRRLHEHKESFIDEALSQTEGSSLGDMLDFLSKELVRIQEERRIHAFSMLAERRRRIREAEESGHRQVEERRRREQDEIFKQAVKVHQQSVDTYLEDVILSSVDATASRQARSEIHTLAQTINDVAYDMESRRTNLQSEEIVAELVHGFLLPEVYKQTSREKVTRQQRKYLLAAHQEIFREGEGVIDMYPRDRTQTDSKQNDDEQKSGSKPGSHAASRSATPDAANLSKRATPDQRTTPQGSRSGSRTATPVQPGSRSGTPVQPGTPVQQSGSGIGTPVKSGSRTESRASAGSHTTPKGSRTATPTGQIGSPHSSVKGSPAPGSRSSTPAKSGSAHGSRSSTPAKSGSGHGSAPGSAHGSAKGSRTATPDQSMSIQGSRTGTPSQKQTPKGSQDNTPRGSRSGSQHSSRAGSPHDSQHS